ncbi:Serine/threonine-protein kinase [Entomortierella beljakovae]|nr:Serine/threonine-protein kinase [Entomortierella beljakovae]
MATAARPMSQTTQVGDYIVEHEIGRGSFATVYKGHHRITKDPVAIKSVLRSKLTKKLLENLASEINILKGIRHDNIVALVDCKETESHIHLIMEYCSQGDLSQYIKRRGDGPPSLPSPPGGGLNETVVRHFLKQLASALEFLRSKNLIHRDLKPQNLLLHPPSNSKEGSGYGLPILKVADFGFARSLPRLSLAETLCGSPLYMAPEILRYEKYDAKADLWSVGTVLFEMCTGKPPFRAQNHVELLNKIETSQDVITFPGDPVMDDRIGSSPSQRHHHSSAVISEDIKDLIRQLLKRNPVERISFEEFFMNPAVANSPLRSRSRSSRSSSSAQDYSRHEVHSGDISKRLSTHESSRNTQDYGYRERGEKKPISIPMGSRDHNEKIAEQPLRSRPRSLKSGSPSAGTENRPPLQLPISSPKSHYAYANSLNNHPQPSHEYITQPSSAPVNTSSARRMKSLEITSMEPASRGAQASSQPYRRSTLVGVPDVSRRYTMPDEDSFLDKDYVVVEKRAVELNALADEVAASPSKNTTRTKNGTGQTLSPPIPASLAQYRAQPPPFAQQNYSTSTQSPPTNANYYSTTPPFAVPAPVPEETKQHQITHRASLGVIQPLPSPISARSGSPREGSKTSALAKAISMASMRLFGASSSPPSWRSNSPLVGFMDSPSKFNGQVELDPEENSILQAIEDAAQKAYVVSQFADSKMDGIRPLDELDYPTPEDHNESILAEEAFFLYLRALALLQAGMNVARQYWEDRRQEAKPASTRLNSGVQWIRDRFNECLEKAEAAKTRSGIDSREESGVVIEKLIYERALELSKAAAMKELVSDEYSESEKSYQTSIWMLHAILDGAGEDGRSDAIEEDDREILNKFIRSIEHRLNSLRRRIASRT